MYCPDVPEQNEVAQLVGANVRRLRMAADLSQSQLAARMVAAGCPDWTGNTVAGVERPDKPRALSVDELTALCAALSCSVEALLAGDSERQSRVMGRSSIAASTNFAALELKARQDAARRALDEHLGSVVSMPSWRVAEESFVVWGRDAWSEREARLTDSENPFDFRTASRTQRLGHITREMARELGDYFAQQLEDSVTRWKAKSVDEAFDAELSRDESYDDEDGINDSLS
jgi:transcriptional regulator with XRE-family HTH domain